MGPISVVQGEINKAQTKGMAVTVGAGVGG